jgi:hypothetical protein
MRIAETIIVSLLLRSPVYRRTGTAIRSNVGQDRGGVKGGSPSIGRPGKQVKIPSVA